MQKILITVMFSILMLGSACAMYQAPAQQGNLITREMVSQLKPGMSDNNRWTYYYRLTEDGELIREYKVILTFKLGRLQKIEGEAPPEAELLKQR
jgi:outer membrane protein assembly factor BamE